MDIEKFINVLIERESYYRSLKNNATDSEQELYYAVGRMDSYTMLIHEIENGKFD